MGRLATPGIFNVGNASVPPDSYVRMYDKRVNSLYGQVLVGYEDYLFATVTGRNDWSSTLPEQSRSYFYPYVSGSFVFSDAVGSLRESDRLSYGKLRASWARAGNDTDPYLLRNTYVASEIWEGSPTFTVPGALQNADLRPEITESIEVGLELAFLDDRLGVDVTYYTEETRDQIFNVNISPTTGYRSRWLNAGTVENKGWELMVAAIPYETATAQWQTSLTWSANENTVIELADGVTGLEISHQVHWGASIFARQGEPYGQIVGRAYERSPDGRILVDAAGYPVRTPTPQVIGNVNPDWRAGWWNQLTLGPFTLSGLLDGKVGGDPYSVSKFHGTFTGVFAETAGPGRCIRAENPDSYYPVCDADTGIIFDGMRSVVIGADTTYVENEVPVDGRSMGFFNNFLIAEANVVDGTFLKLRELSVSYDLPESWVTRARMSAAQITLIGRNLWLWTPSDNPHFDPEHVTEASNVQEFEYGQIPPARSFGFKLTARP